MHLNWYSLGFPSNPKTTDPLFNKFGVYLWLYHGNPNRVIYVGTACSGLGFKGRNAQPVGEAYYGLGYAFKLENTCDPYDYLNTSGDKFIELIEQNMFYTPEYKE